jgi:hypothetical protein
MTGRDRDRIVRCADTRFRVRHVLSPKPRWMLSGAKRPKRRRFPNNTQICDIAFDLALRAGFEATTRS